MDEHSESARVDPGIEGLEAITHGGLPEGRLSLIAGTAGSGKTVFATQFLAAAIAAGEAGVFVNFEERPEAIRSDVRSFGWDIVTHERDGRWAFVDVSADFGADLEVAGPFDLSPLIARVEHAVEQTGAQRVAVDAIGALLVQFDDPRPARKALFRLARSLNDLGVTTVMTAERMEDYGPIAHFGFEEFIADNVLILRNPLGKEKRRRTIEVLKIRGGSHEKGEHLFTIKPGRGIVVVPNVGRDFDFESSTRRLTSGDPDLDEMLDGGLFDRSLVLVTGATGSGKSLIATQFAAGGVDAGERALLLSFEESRHQILRNAASWGIDCTAMEEAGKLRILAEPPESRSLEDHLLTIKAALADFRPDRVAIDSLTALERVATVESFREYVIGLTLYMKSNDVLGMMTATAIGPSTDMTLTDLHVSTITDTIITLRYVEVDGHMLHGLNVLKMRGSDHDKALREFRIDHDGLHVLGPFQGVSGMVAMTSAQAAGAQDV